MPAPHLVPQPNGGVWDSALYGTLLLEGYMQTQEPHNQRSSNMYSEPFYRRYRGPAPIALQVGVEQTIVQWRAFEAFWTVDLVWGSLWFELPLTSVGADDSFTVHLSSWTVAPKPGTQLSINRLDMTLEALLLDPPVP